MISPVKQFKNICLVTCREVVIICPFFCGDKKGIYNQQKSGIIHPPAQIPHKQHNNTRSFTPLMANTEVLNYLSPVRFWVVPCFGWFIKRPLYIILLEKKTSPTVFQYPKNPRLLIFVGWYQSKYPLHCGRSSKKNNRKFPMIQFFGECPATYLRIIYTLWLWLKVCPGKIHHAINR